MNPSLSHDLALKRTVHTPVEKKPHFAWRDLLTGESLAVPAITLLCPHGEERFDASEVADTLGKALTNVLLAKGERDIFTAENRAWVVNIVRELVGTLSDQARRQSPLRLSLSGLYELIEKTLVDNNAYDVAKSLLLNRSHKLAIERPSSATSHIRVIRRNHQVVPFVEQKIEIAVRKSFLSLRRDSAPAVGITQAVAARVHASKQTFVHIEEIQDMVQEELMKAGHFKVAEAYILYRAERAVTRDTGAPTGAAAEAGEVPAAPAAGQETMVVVKRANGETYFWDAIDLRKRIEFARIGLDLCLTNEQIEAELRRSVFDQISQRDLDATIILNSKTLIERDADFAKFAGRIQLTYIYEEVLGWDIVRDGIGALRAAHQRAFRKYLEHGVAIKRLNPRLLELDLEKLGASLDPSADLEFDFLGIQTLYDRYLIIDKTRKPSRRIETPQFFWMRVSMGLFIDEAAGAREERICGLYDLYKNRRFCSSTPTLFNSGTLHSQLSSCYLYYVDDSLEGIMYRGIAENAQLSKWAGGLGGSWTAVRGTGAYIGGTNGESQGVIPFLKLHNDQLVAVNQGGKRKGSGCAYLETWHNDIFEFLELRKNTGDDRRRTHDMNTANWIPDLFMKRMEARGSWTLFRSNEVKDLHDLYGRRFEEAYLRYEKLAEEGKLFGQKIEALELWKRMLSMLFETGHPWITFKDACNVRSPQQHVGVVHSSNLCTEITLNTSETEIAVCNLGSVNLAQHIKDGQVDHDKLKRTVATAMRMLDNVIDVNYYAVKKARDSNLRHRPVGLGIMGFQDALHELRLSYASQDAVDFADRSMEALCYYAYWASTELAAERGRYETYEGSLWDRGILPMDTLDMLAEQRGGFVDVDRSSAMDWEALRARIQTNGMRNSNCVAIAPTATISNIVGVSASIEPSFGNLSVKSNLSGEFTMVNESLVRDLKRLGLWDDVMVMDLKHFDGSLQRIDRVPLDLKTLYATAFEIETRWLVEAAARRQKWIDQGQSLNIYMAGASGKKLDETYKLAWVRGLKTTYYLRTVGATHAEKSTVTAGQMNAVSSGAGEAQPSASASHAAAVEPATDVKFCAIDDPGCESCQ